jgi:hypothetical protein
MNTDKTKTEREKIEEKLHSGMTPKQVIAQGHARSTVYQVAQRALIPDTSEIAELREKKAILKLKAGHYKQERTIIEPPRSRPPSVTLFLRPSGPTFADYIHIGHVLLGIYLLAQQTTGKLEDYLPFLAETKRNLARNPGP